MERPKKKPVSVATAFIAVALCGYSAAYAQDTPTGSGGTDPASETIAKLGSDTLRNPNELEEQWRQNRQQKKSFFGPVGRNAAFEEWRQGLNEKGLLLDLSATHIIQHSDSTETSEDTASSYELLLFGTWTPIGFGTESPLTFGFETFFLERLGTDITPIELSANIGSGWPTAVALDNSRLILGQTWVQKKFNNKIGFRLGRLFAISAYDYFPLKNWRTDFADGINSANLVMPIPSPIGWGGFAMYKPTPKVYIRAGFHDANADSTEIGFDTWEGETFKILEIGFDPGIAERQQGAPPPGDIHLSFWQQDARDDLNIDDGWGVAFSASQRFGNYLPFFRAGFSEGGTDGPALLEKSVSFGFAVDNILPNNSDRLGLSYSWGDPTADGLRNQKTIDAFYRFQVTDRLAISPMAQYIIDPVNSDEDDIFVVGLRTRFAF